MTGRLVTVRRWAGLLALLALSASGPSGAAEPEAGGELSLHRLPAASLRGLAPLLRQAEVVLIESKPGGELRQLTVVTLVAAPPEQVREVVLGVDRYPEFVRNLSRSRLVKNSDGSFDHFYQLSYVLFGIDGHHRYLPLPADGESDAPAVEISDPEPQHGRRFRFEFYAAGGATVMVMYGAIDLRHSIELVGRLLRSVPMLEHGLALMAELTFALSVRERAEQLMAPVGVLLPASGPADYDFLLQRGAVALFRSTAGRLKELTLTDTSSASPQALIEVAAQAGRYAQFVPTIKASGDGSPLDDLPTASLELSLPLLTLRSRYAIRALSTSVDLLGVGGDLSGSRLRWDVAASRIRPGQTQVVLRSQQSLDRTSILLHQLYRREPLFEHGVTLGLQLVLLRSVMARAEAPNG